MKAEPRVVGLTGLPTCDSCGSDASTLMLFGDAYVAYNTNAPVDPIALLRFDSVMTINAPGPNDEAFHNHRWYSLGLKPYTLQEIVHSPWIDEVRAQQHKDLLLNLRPGLRHFVLALKETTVDVLAIGVDVVGRFATHGDALQSALAPAKFRSKPLAPADAQAFAASWYAAWNAHDLNAIMAHYAPTIRHSSPFIKRYNGTDAMALEGIPPVRAYFGRALDRNPTLRFDPLHTTTGLESVILVYRRITGDLAAEIFFFDDSMKIVRSVSHYG